MKSLKENLMPLALGAGGTDTILRKISHWSGRGKPIKANLKPKPKMEVPGNKTLAGANPIFFTSAGGSFAASAARATARMGDLSPGMVGDGIHHL